MVSTSICYDICPVGYYGNTVSWTCQPCLYDCYECTTSTTCSVCNSTLHFRIMNNSTSRCIPLVGYYDDGLNHAVALPCNSSLCLECTGPTTCTSCQPGKFKVGSVCNSCPVNCANCTNSTVCVGCMVPYSLSGTICVLNCSLAVANCTSCIVNGSTVTCQTCSTGLSYISANNSC